MIHASFIVGQLLFAGVTFFTVRPNRETPAPIAPPMLYLIFGAALAACVLSLVLRQQVPRRSRETSPDLFWQSAGPKAMVAWFPLEAAGLFALVQYFQTANPVAVAAAALPVGLLVVLNPWVLERP